MRNANAQALTLAADRPDTVCPVSGLVAVVIELSISISLCHTRQCWYHTSAWPVSWLAGRHRPPDLPRPRRIQWLRVEASSPLTVAGAAEAFGAAIGSAYLIPIDAPKVGGCQSTMQPCLCTCSPLTVKSFHPGIRAKALKRNAPSGLASAKFPSGDARYRAANRMRSSTSALLTSPKR